MIARIQKRITTCVSFQPVSSKWWCSGDILKMRRPVGLERGDLQDHRQRLDHEQAADERQEHLLLDHHGEAADRAAQGERADVAHEDLGGMALNHRKPSTPRPSRRRRPPARRRPAPRMRR